MFTKKFAATVTAVALMTAGCGGADGSTAAQPASSTATSATTTTTTAATTSSSAVPAGFTACGVLPKELVVTAYQVGMNQAPSVYCTDEATTANEMGAKTYTGGYSLPVTVKGVLVVIVDFGKGGAGAEKVLLDAFPVKNPDLNATPVSGLGTGGYSHTDGSKLTLASGKPVGPDMALVTLISTAPQSATMLPQLETVMRSVLDNITELPA
ncbi:lipase chaperone [Actinosynnema pretiosum subsp. pretiosum]|uniref:Secreted protein n=2 Tax=Actinosynnema TaxID=40566 RepID=C6W9S0_ACTMD|nr:lipase chaperone [Actinosynnema mirum]ACU37287.1 hypothetical protein Amir_3387 [Actinosynnema mirum DSM 43827]AXX30756.1 hypothetical protein APASM_3391 [Actinosynnema pretiosum subsp. pretiosum]QUF05127.1 lipase chaperone [Actinosynnema pretiosum subsp. pretiosum]